MLLSYKEEKRNAFQSKQKFQSHGRVVQFVAGEVTVTNTHLAGETGFVGYQQFLEKPPEKMIAEEREIYYSSHHNTIA